MNVFVAGGSGFVGSSLCRILDDRGHSVTAGSRTPNRSKLPDSVETVSADVTEADLSDVVSGYDVVVNLAALPAHVEPAEQSHAAVHRDGTRNLVRAAKAVGIDRFVQISALGVDAGVDTAFFEAKRQAERIIRGSGLDWIVYRPSVVFGDGCAFVPFVERMTPPLLAPLPDDGQMRIQPIWVEDLASTIADGVVETGRLGQVYEIAGPKQLTVAETVKLICGSKLVVPISMSTAALGFTLAGLLPGVSVGMDQYRLLKLDNTTTRNHVTSFGISEDELLTLREYLERE